MRQIIFGATALAAACAWAGTRVTVTIRDWTGKEVRTVSGLTDTGTFSLDAADYFNAPVDYVTAFDGGTVSAAPSTDVASGSVVTWEGVTEPLTTEIFVQPRVAYKNFAKYLMGDPWVVKNPTADVWYVTYTKATTGLSVYRTTVFPTNDFGSSRTGYNFKSHPEDVGAYTNYIWAPEIHCIQDRWYAYISASSSAKSSNYERPFALRLEGDNPYSSNWKMGAKLVTPGGDRWAIDGTILDDTAASGRLYYIWSGWPSTANGVQNLYIAEMSSPTSFVQNAGRILISAPTESWETKTTSPCKVNEGPVVLRHGNAVHIVYSCNGCWTDDYSLALLTCTDGNFLNPSSWTKSSQRLFVSRPGAYGPGHCSFMRTADGQDMIVYHAKYESGHSSDYYKYRDIRMQPIAWHGDYPVFGAPRPYDNTLTSDPLDLNADYSIPDPTPVPGVITTNAMANASWGYVLSGLGAASNEVAQVFTNVTEAMTWTVPSDVTSIRYLVVGGGGSGATQTWNGNGSCGGGCGGSVIKDSATVTAGATVTITVGVGGASPASTANGNTGVASVLACGETLSVSATGGAGGSYVKTATSGGKGGDGAGSEGLAGDTHIGGAGGDGVSTDGIATLTGLVGAGGGGGGTGGSNTSFIGGKGGTTGGGKGGTCYNNLSYAQGGSGAYYGAGGGGAGSHNKGTGGAGYQGIVVIRYATGATPGGRLSHVDRQSGRGDQAEVRHLE